MALAPGIACDAEMLETLRLCVSKISPRELEVYAASTPAFGRGGFRPGNTALVRSRILSMLASGEPIDAKLRGMLRDQVRRSLEAGGGNVHLQKELEAARVELARLKGADSRLEHEGEVRAALEADLEKTRAALAEAESGRGALRQRAERAEAQLARVKTDADRHVDAVLQVRLAEEMARFFAGRGGARAVAEPVADAAGKIAAAIAVAPDRELAMWKSAVDKVASAGALTREDHEFLLSCVRRRYTELHMQGFENLVPKDGELSTPTGLFMQALAGKLPAILLVDAHNALFALQSRYRLPNEHRWPTAQTRQWLVDDVVQLLENAPNFRAYIVFDGPERTESMASPNVQVVYSGGTGEHRADGVLVDQARFLSEAGAQNMLIVTNDGELAGLASRHGARSIAPTVLLSVM